MNIQDCKTFEQYKKMCGVSSASKMTAKQMFDWVKADKTNDVMWNSVWVLEHGSCGRKPDMVRALKLLAEALDSGKTFVCDYLPDECVQEKSPGINKPGDEESYHEYFAMDVV